MMTIFSRFLLLRAARRVNAFLLALLLSSFSLSSLLAASAETPFSKMKDAINKRAGVSTLQNSSDFGVGWKPKPLVDYTTPKPAVGKAMPTAPKPVGTVNPATEAFLKPMVPFISSVEKELLIKPAGTQSIQGRLDHLQSVLFGDKLYPNPSDALAKIAALYPAQAAQSRQQLISDMQKKTLSPRAVHMPNGSKPFPGTQKPTYGYTQPARQPAYASPDPAASSRPGADNYGGSTSINNPIVRPLYPQKSAVQPQQPVAAASPAPRKQPSAGSGWKSLLSSTDDDFWGGDDPFDDPFFTGKPKKGAPAPQALANQTQTYQQQQPNSAIAGQTYHAYVPPVANRPAPQPKAPSAVGSTVKALGQGVLGLASIAAPIAGNYYLNKATGGGSAYPNNGYYGPGYGYGNNPYGAYPYNAYPYNNAYANNLGYGAYGVLPGQAYSRYPQYQQRPSLGFNNGIGSYSLGSSLGSASGYGTSMASTRLAVPRLGAPRLGMPQLRTAPTYYSPYGVTYGAVGGVGGFGLPRW